MRKRTGFPRTAAIMGILLCVAVLAGLCRICQAMCTLEEPSADEIAIDEKKRALVREYGVQDPEPGMSAMDIAMGKKRAEYEECIRRNEKVLKDLGQKRYDEIQVENGLFRRDKITGQMWFVGPDGKREIKIH
jgi:hypothetical protein